MFHYENRKNKKRDLSKNAFNQKGATAALLLTTSLLALTPAAPASAWEKPYTIINTISFGGTPGISGSSPLGLAVDPVRGTLYATNTNYPNKGSVVVIDEATGTVTATIQVGEYPYAIAVDPIHYMVWVTDYLGASVSAIDERTNIVVATLPVGTLPHDITVDPFQGTVYVANDGGRNVAVIDEATLTVTTTVAVPNNLPTVGIGVDPIRGLVGVTTFTSGFLKSYLNVLDENTDQFINTITLGSGGSDSNDVGRLVVDPVRGFVYLPQYFAGTLQVLDEKTATITKTIVSTTLTNPGDGGPGTNGIALDPFTGTVYVANINVGTVSVIDPVKGYVKATVTIPNASDELSGTAVDPILGLAYVANYNNNTISVISTGKGTSCEEIKDYPLLPLYCKTDLLKVKDRY